MSLAVSYEVECFGSAVLCSVAPDGELGRDTCKVSHKNSDTSTSNCLPKVWPDTLSMTLIFCPHLSAIISAVLRATAFDDELAESAFDAVQSFVMVNTFLESILL